MPQYRVFETDFEKDRHVIVDIWRRNLADVAKLEEKLVWHFLDNPGAKGRCWLLEADGVPVGAASIGMRMLEVGGQVVTAGVACDLAVDKEHRYLQPALLLQKAVLAAASPEMPIVYGLPNAAGGSVMRRAGYCEVLQVHRYAKVLRPSRYLDRTVAGPFVPWLARVADHAYTAPSAFREKLSRSYSAAQFIEFDGRFDELWARLRPLNAMTTVRSSRFLRWRYRECPIHEYSIIGLLRADCERLVGYLVYRMENDSAICNDLFCDMDEERLDCLISAWANRATEAGMVSLSVMGATSAAALAALDRMGFVRRTVSAPANGSGRREGEGSRPLLACGQLLSGPAISRWYFTFGDSPYT